jgi:hypothetical protein
VKTIKMRLECWERMHKQQLARIYTIFCYKFVKIAITNNNVVVNDNDGDKDEEDDYDDDDDDDDADDKIDT